ncbi:helix-turn-helix transcriptional regulator [Micromonospora sp. WMMD1082]|uniref:helix-turn-helix domain-containing protein n=1 Tax=Micromonospora sp. WMMD1082 TaxID=3016104 RepID=UPI002417B147|nr:helix-turn-helix transcriptional regulator [Micromonospora sp. WMMD1082]MDG4798828.1 helix-turn-helix transcriptional regulator [Micromonospora sp. WMMD1082]
MDLSTRRQPPTVRLRRLASELRNLRQAAGLTREDAAVQTNINSATLYRIETAKARPQRRTLLTLLDKYGVTDPTRRAALVEMSKQATQLGWLQAYESELPEEYTTYISFESEARSVRNYESLFVPGLLQTEGYTRAVVTASLPSASDEEIQQRVETRAQRQTSITKDDPLKLWAIVDEAVLHREVGGPEVMVDQLRHLLDMTRQPHITFQVLPYKVGAHPGMHGAFAVMDFPDTADPELVYIENMAGALYLEKEADVRRYAEMFDQLRAAALNVTDSRRLVARLIDID